MTLPANLTERDLLTLYRDAADAETRLAARDALDRLRAAEVDRRVVTGVLRRWGVLHLTDYKARAAGER